jgi:tartrate dehydrogenase/decarboxylase / D-malate dehydrogenase
MDQERRSSLRVAVIPGDGIGIEVVGAALPLVVEAAGAEGVALELTELDWGGDRLVRTGEAMPEDALAVVRSHDVVLLGAVGHSDLAPDVSVWTLTLRLRKELNLYANVRPIRIWPGLEPIVRDAEGADLVIVRENTEGEYSGVGGRVHAGLPDELATDVIVHSRRAVLRVARYAFELARARGDALTLATKSNVMPGYKLWDEVVQALGDEEYPDVEVEKNFVDALGARLVQSPATLGVVLAGNMFGDILSDVAAPLTGGLGMAPSANVGPGTGAPGVYEPVHGSAPDIAGRGIANPIASILSGAMLLRDSGLHRAATRLEEAVATAVLHDEGRTPDIGGRGTTASVAAAVAHALQAAPAL